MKIAVTYDNGNIFQHFGRTEQFKIYEVEYGTVVSSEIMDTNGTGHEALAQLLAEQGVKTVICGGLGGGAKAALDEADIEVISGVQGSVDGAVAAFIAGDLESTGVNCDHHEEEEHSCCGGEEEDGCGGSCGGCGGGCGGCGGGLPKLEGRNVDKTVRVHYKGTFNDGTQFDSSYDRGEPLEFICGAGMMIRGFDAAVADMELGQAIDIHLMPEEAYGMPNPNAIFTVEIQELPGSENLKAGDKVYLTNTMGQPFPATVAEKTDTSITFDANHEMAGKELNFHIELVEII